MYLIYNIFFNFKNKTCYKYRFNDRSKNCLISVILYNIFYPLIVLCILFINKCNAEKSTNMEMDSTIAGIQIIQQTTKVIDYDTHVLYDDNSIPPSFDARRRWPHCTSIGEIKNQGSCKSGWAIAIASVITDRMCIQKGKVYEDMSAYNLLSCCDNCCGCRGGSILKAWEYVKDIGLLTGGSYGSKIGCQPYMIRPCKGKTNSFDECGWKSDVVPDCVPTKCTNKIYSKKNVHFGYKNRINDYVLLSRVKHKLIMKELYFNGPVQVSMHLFDDFRWHKKGVYTHTSGYFDGDHAVKLIGWDDHKNWLLINSFGVMWGDNGTFLIPRDHVESDCDFGYTIVAPRMNGTIDLFSNAIPSRFDCKLYILYSMLNIFLKFELY